jgi:hypothetical protein
VVGIGVCLESFGSGRNWNLYFSECLKIVCIFFRVLKIVCIFFRMWKLYVFFSECKNCIFFRMFENVVCEEFWKWLKLEFTFFNVFENRNFRSLVSLQMKHVNSGKYPKLTTLEITEFRNRWENLLEET